MNYNDSAAAVLVVWMAAVAYYDLRYRKIPNILMGVVLLPAALTVMLLGYGYLGQNWLSSVSGAALAFVLFLPGYLRHSLGGGDIKYATICGMLVGFPGALLMVFLTCVGLGLYSVVLLVSRVKDVRRRSIPAGAVLSASLFLCMSINRSGGLL